MFHVKNEQAKEQNGATTAATELQNGAPIEEQVLSETETTINSQYTKLSDACFAHNPAKKKYVGDFCPLEDSGGIETGGPPARFTCIKEELDIGPTELQRTDMQFMLLPFKPDPGGHGASCFICTLHQCNMHRSNENIGRSLKQPVSPGRDTLQILDNGQLTSNAHTNCPTGTEHQLATTTVLQPVPTDPTKHTMATCTERPTYTSKVRPPPAPQETSNCDEAIVEPTNIRANNSGNCALKRKVITTTFQCDHCQKIFSWKYKLIGHITSHSPKFIKDKNVIDSSSKKPRPFQCEACGKYFSCKGDLIVHIRVHTKERPYACTVCHKKFSRANNAKVHMKLHTRQSYQCFVCKKKFSTKGALTSHMLLHAKVKPNRGFVREKKCGTKDALTSQMTKERPYPCPICGKRFTQQSGIYNHLIVHTKEQPYQCSICNKKFTTKQALIVHIRVHTEEPQTRKPKLKCTICKREFELPSLLKLHAKQHLEELRHPCTVCDKKFMNHKSRLSHMREHAEEYRCNICGKNYAKQANLEVHCVRMHVEEYPRECKLCHKTFDRQNAFCRHLRKRLEPSKRERLQYQCAQCEKIVFYKSNLVRHMLIHTNERPYKCTVCAKTFIVKYSLDSHSKMHTKDRPYQCEICKKQFRHKQYFAVHMKVHTK